jgi:hypothetical protein
MLNLDGGRLLVAVSQAAAACLLLHALPSGRSRAVAAIMAGTVLWVPEASAAFFSLDPGWICAVPLVGALTRFLRWHRTRNLRDLVLGAVDAGFLACAGVGGALVAAAVLTGMAAHIGRDRRLHRDDRVGMRFLLWAPFAYGAVLVVVSNWLVMNDILFCFRSLWGAFWSHDADGLARGAGHAVRSMSLLVPAAAAVLVLRWGRCPLPGVLLPALAAMAAAWTVHGALQLHCAGGPVMLVGIAGLTLAWSAGSPAPGAGVRPVRTAAWAAVLVVLGVAPLRQAAVAEDPPAFGGDAPPREQIVAYVDRYWPRSRIVLYGVVAPALYPDLAEQRFVARLDVNENMFMELAAAEQIHLLLPPPSGAFYPARYGPLGDIHRNGRPWLLLERTWPSGWQLWRAVMPPTGESKLKDLGIDRAYPAPGQ